MPHRDQKNSITGKTLHSRRRFLSICSGVAVGVLANPTMAAIDHRSERILSFNNLHTGEHLKATYWAAGQYIPEELYRIALVLRDHRTGDKHAIYPQLLNILFAMQRKIDNNHPFHIISGYRSPETNRMLHNNTSGVAKQSLHMEGKAIDLRLPGYDLRQLRRAAITMKAGGVGYYPKSDFIHIDIGQIRTW